ncbi:NADPH-dependent FMN reductase [Psychrobium sp. 1_MG-2023]|uniref:NADPH-dependent FMN reductase n=1 Tax=Psychrobium sp. 1_MG-2023 TaxID=3062624 RepID=UPI000C32B143|nr:NAD(P)H-dependent oxidoreductase [Psychrobium sp. 1_MG-2023]MDP2561171.1 NAD(P)H-dependent oxidoreductase [Psychrobium sp. 1_MG-2023]PKF55144.1 NADPH-dependent FMN reductase [Alteromonadales bacterium alter-6D02]
MKVLAFAASNSRNSINQQLAQHAASLIPGAQVETLDINDYEMPIFSEDREKELGQPQLAQDFYNKLGQADAIIIGFAEHNGHYSAAFKNLFDWTSRVERGLYQNKPLVFLATSPGPGGAKTVLSAAVASAPHFAGNVTASLSVPSFYDNFDTDTGTLRNEELAQQLQAAVATLPVPVVA